VRSGMRSTIPEHSPHEMTALDLYQQMLLVRVLEEELQTLCDTGEGSDMHFNRGQEAIAIGVCAALQPTDFTVTHHRMIAHAVAKGVPLYPLVAELLGKADGVNGGMAGEMHLRHPASGFMHSFQLVGTALPVAAGLAWAAKYYQKIDAIVAVFCGDAATSNGQFHEGMNLAAVQKVPLLVICENNGLAGNVRSPVYLPTKTVAERASAYGIRAVTIDGNRVDEVFRVAKEASAYVREESQPFMVECNTTRISRHKQGQGDLRTKEEIADLAKRDPLLYEEKRLGLGLQEKASLLAATRALVQEVVTKVRAAPAPRFPTP